MALIYESENFRVESMDQPLVAREDGGHLVINPKKRVGTIQHYTASQAIELMRLLMIAGEAMNNVMNGHGVDIGRINYQDNGNWSVFNPEGPAQHFHLYGRAKSASRQPYGQSLHFPHKNTNPEFYSTLEPLTTEDLEAIRSEMERLFKEERYGDSTWFQGKKML